MTKKEANSLGYVEVENCQNAINHLKQRVELGKFIYANLKERDFIFSLASAKLNSVMSRLRILFYEILIVSLIRLPLLVCVIILSLETVFLYYYVYGGCRHRYPRQWLVYISTLNTSFLNMIILLNMMYSIVSGSPAPLSVQSLLILVIIVIIIFEFIILVLRILSQIFTFLYLIYKRFRGKDGENDNSKMFIKKWVRGERLTEYMKNVESKESKNSVKKVLMNNYKSNKCFKLNRRNKYVGSSVNLFKKFKMMKLHEM